MAIYLDNKFALLTAVKIASKIDDAVMLRISNTQEVTVIANDPGAVMQIGIQVPAKVTTQMAISVSAEWLIRVLSAIPAMEPVAIRNRGKTITVEYGETVFGTECLPDVLPLLDVDTEAMIIVHKSALREALSLVSGSIANDDGRFATAIEGVNVSSKKGALTLVGADGYELSMATLPIVKNGPFSKKLPQTVYRDSVDALQEILYWYEAGENDTVGVTECAEGRGIAFLVGNHYLYTGKIPKPYPYIEPTMAYREKSTIVIPLSRPFLRRCLREVERMVGHPLAAILTVVDEKTAQVSISEEFGKYTSKLETACRNVGFEIAFDTHSVSEALDRMESNQVVLRCSEPLKPIFFEDEAMPDFVYIRMPMQKGSIYA